MLLLLLLLLEIEHLHLPHVLHAQQLHLLVQAEQAHTTEVGGGMLVKAQPSGSPSAEKPRPSEMSVGSFFQ